MEFKTTPFRHQLQEFEKYKDKNFVALFHEMGTGKTKLVIDILRYKCYNHGKALKTLIICPKIAIHNWKEEIELHSSLSKYTELLIGTKQKKIEKLNTKGKTIFIVNFESVKSIYNNLLLEWDCIIVDESQRIKNPRAICTKAILSLSKIPKYRYILSGTPILNNPIDIFTQAKFLDNGYTFGRSFSVFKTQYFEDKNAWMKVSSSKSLKYFPKLELKLDKMEEFRSKILSFSSIIKNLS